MTRYACTQPSCPRRSPVSAAEPPTCYTCGGKMAAVLRTIDDAEVLHSDNIHWPPPFEDVAFDGVPVTYDSANALALGQRITAAVSAALPPPTVRLSAPEQTPDQRARRELGPISITIERIAVADPEALAREIQAELLRVSLGEDDVPYVDGGYGLLAKHGARPVDEAPEAIEADARKPYELLLRRALDGYAMLFRIAAPQFKSSGSCAELRLEEAVNAQQWAFLFDAHRHNRDLAIECPGLLASSLARIDGMASSESPGGGYHVRLLIKAILAPEPTP